MKLISLSQGKFAVVDDEDYEWLMQWKWYAARSRAGGWYAKRMTSRKSGCHRPLRMHREILRLGKGDADPDHRNRNGLDNRRSNLRLCTNSQNAANRGLQSNNTSGFKGVSWHKQTRRWRCRVKKDGIEKHVGLFDTKIEAAIAYDDRSLDLHGEFASLNFPWVYA